MGHFRRVWAASYHIEKMLNSLSAMKVLQLYESIFVPGRHILTYLRSKCQVCNLFHSDEQNQKSKLNKINTNVHIQGHKANVAKC